MLIPLPPQPAGSQGSPITRTGLRWEPHSPSLQTQFCPPGSPLPAALQPPPRFAGAVSAVPSPQPEPCLISPLAWSARWHWALKTASQPWGEVRGLDAWVRNGVREEREDRRRRPRRREETFKGPSLSGSSPEPHILPQWKEGRGAVSPPWAKRPRRSPSLEFWTELRKPQERWILPWAVPRAPGLLAGSP